jgi:hypothetical protein
MIREGGQELNGSCRAGKPIIPTGGWLRSWWMTGYFTLPGSKSKAIELVNSEQ